MNKLLSIGEIAKLTNTSTETLRHYDRIGLLKPTKIDSISGYRYYSEIDIIYMNVINFCKTKNMSLKDIKEVLEKDDLEYMVDFLYKKEKEIDNEIEMLKTTKSQIKLLKDRYNTQLTSNNKHFFDNEFKEKYIHRRAIIEIEELKDATIENFINFDEILKKKICNFNKNEFYFDNSINLISKTSNNKTCTSMFVLCNKYPEDFDIVTYLQEGIYLYTFCKKEEKDITIKNIINYIKNNYSLNVDLIIQNVIFTGMFKWIYEIQVLIKKNYK